MQDSAVKADVKLRALKVLPDVKIKPRAHVTYKNTEEAFHHDQISAMILSRLKKLACKLFCSPVKKVVIAIPATFNDTQWQATIDVVVVVETWRLGPLEKGFPSKR